MITLRGPPVALAAEDNNLAAVWREGPQTLSVAVYDINHRERKSDGPLPVSEGAELTWLAFTADGQLATFDSQARHSASRTAKFARRLTI